MANFNNPYLNPNPGQYTQIQGSVYARLVGSEQEALSMPNPATGCAFFIDGENLVTYVKYSDGRPMEIYDMQQRLPAPPPQYLTVDDFNRLMDEKMNELAKRFVVRKERSNG